MQMMSEEKYGFIVTKPLQLMVVLALLEQLPRAIKKEIYVVDSFHDAETVANRLAEYRLRWGEVFFVRTPELAFQYASCKSYKKLFFDSDVGLQKYIQLIRLKIKVPKLGLAIYEEGLGTYRADLYVGWKRKVLDIVGAGTSFGGCFLTNEVYVFEKKEYVNKHPANKIKVVQLEMSVEGLIKYFANEIDYIFKAESIDSDLEAPSDVRDCVIYLTGWVVNNQVVDKLSNYSGFKIIKPHPHIKNMHKYKALGFASLNASIPAELLVRYAAAKFEQTKVIHHGSSVERYVNPANVEFIMADKYLADVQFEARSLVL